jgi:hypothetical protein
MEAEKAESAGQRGPYYQPDSLSMQPTSACVRLTILLVWPAANGRRVWAALSLMQQQVSELNSTSTQDGVKLLRPAPTESAGFCLHGVRLTGPRCRLVPISIPLGVSPLRDCFLFRNLFLEVNPCRCSAVESRVYYRQPIMSASAETRTSGPRACSTCAKAKARCVPCANPSKCER